MSSEKLQRTSYRDPNTPDNRVRTGTPTLAENGQDMDQYYRPLERIHGSNLHGWGVASGLEVSATLNSASLTIQPGMALDSSGRHIALAVGSNAEVGANPDGFSTGASFIPVTASGLALPTTGISGKKYLTIQFWETFDSDGFQTSGLFRYFHTPWVRLVDVEGFHNDGTRIVLAKLSLGAVGQVTALAQDLRQATDLPVGSIHLQKSITTSLAANSQTVNSMEAGVMRGRATGGIDVTVPNATDEVHLERDDGGNCAKVSLGAERIVARQGNGTESLVIDTEAGSIVASGPISANSIVANGAITADGNISSNGDVTVAGSVNAKGSLSTSDGVTTRSIRVTDSSNNTTISLDGDSIFVAGQITVQDTTHLRETRVAGDLTVTGTLHKGALAFKIDHPLDPANKYLSHAGVESPDMKNIYDGIAVLDTNGEAIVELPAWFETLNIDFRYQLTCLGDYAPVYIAEKIHDQRFKIAGGKPAMEVSWQVTGIRQDAYANAHRIPVEQDKPAQERGYYLHPELHGQPEEKQAHRVRSPEISREILLNKQ